MFGGLGDFVGGIFGSGSPSPDPGVAAGGGGSYGPFLAALASAGLGAFSSSRNASNALKQQGLRDQMTLDENEKNRALEMQKLMLQLANQSGGGDNGAGMANVQRQALADRMQSALQGNQNNQSALQLFLQGIQRPYGAR